MESAAPTMVRVLHHSWPMKMPTPEARKHSPASPKSIAKSREMIEDSRPRDTSSQELPRGVGHHSDGDKAVDQKKYAYEYPHPEDASSLCSLVISPSSYNHDATCRGATHRQVAYSPNLVEGEFSEVRLLGILQSS